MTISTTITDFLEMTISGSKSTRYIHCLLTEESQHRSYLIDYLKNYLHVIHEDVKNQLLQATMSLDPLEPDNHDSFWGYPSLLPMQTLKGYFGEAFAALVAENFAPFGETPWKVPAHLFRWHNAAFEYLESLHQGGKKLKSVIGRTGDDCLAFQMNTSGIITKVLFCEAKCTKNHSTRLIKDAHEKVGSSQIVSIQHLIATLTSRNDDDSRMWANALQQFRFRSYKYDFERYDLVSYVCGQHPKDTSTWIPTDKSHPDYTGGRCLQTVEVHLHDVDDIIKQIYEKIDDESDNDK